MPRKKRRERAVRQSLAQKQRLPRLRELCMAGVPSHRLPAYAKAHWQIEPEEVRKDLAKLHEVIAQEVATANLMNQLWLAKEQREWQIDQVRRRAEAEADSALWCRQMTLCHQMMKERERLIVTVIKHRPEPPAQIMIPEDDANDAVAEVQRL